MSRRLKISVGIPTYNRPKYLRQALYSIASQTRLPDEVIVLDDNPRTDENYKVVLEFQKDFSFIKYLRNEVNLGAFQSYRKLLSILEGDVIRLMGDDDIFFPQAIETSEKAFLDFPEVDVVCSRTIFIDRKLNPIVQHPGFWGSYYSEYFRLFNDTVMDGQDFIRESLIRSVNLCVAFPFMKKKKIDLNGLKFREFDFTVNFDWFLWMSVLRKGGKIFLSSKNLFGFRIDENEQLSLEKNVIGIKEKLIFLSEEFLEYLNVKFSKRERAQAIEKVILNAFLIRDMLIKNNRKDLLERLNSIILSFAEKIRKDASYLLHINFRKTREPFSVVIVTYNNQHTIQECLESVLKTLKEGDEIIVVDNASEDRTQDILKRFETSSNFVRCIFNKENIFYAKAANVGARASRNKYVVFLNPDTVILTPDWLNVFYETLKKEDVGAVGPVSDKAMSGNNVVIYSSLNWEYTPVWMRYFFDGVEEDQKFLSGFCIATKKDVLEKMGYFDEKLILGMDDFDFCLRLSEMGMKMKVVPSVFVRHIWGVSFKSNIDSWKINELSIINFAKKLSDKYGYGNVPLPEKLFTNSVFHFYPYEHMKLTRFRFLFDFSGTKKTKEFFVSRAKVLRSKPEICIVTVNYNSSEDLRELAESVLKSRYPKINMVVVDNSESEDEYERVREIKKIFGDNFHIIRTQNEGFAAGCNIGIRYAREVLKTEYIWLLNPDTVVVEDTPFELLKTVLYTDVPVATCKIKIYGTNYAQYDGVRASEQPFEEKDYGLFRANFLPGANIFLRSEVFDRVGMLREDFFLYFEDNDFFERLKVNRIYPIYTPYTFIYHKVRGNYGILEKPINLYYFIRNILFFFSEQVLNGKFKKGAFFEVFDKLRSIYFTVLSLSFDKSARAVIHGIFDFFDGRMGKNAKIPYELERSRENVFEELASIDIPKPGQKVDLRTYMNIMKINLILSPNMELFERYIQGLCAFLFRDLLQEIDYLYV